MATLVPSCLASVLGVTVISQHHGGVAGPEATHNALVAILYTSKQASVLCKPCRLPTERSGLAHYGEAASFDQQPT
jgi:hypothetical protein